MRRLLVLATLALLSLPLLAMPSPVEGATTQVPCSDPRGCPDLISQQSTMQPHLKTKNFKAQDCNVQEGSTKAGTRTLLEFTFTTPNLGPGDLIVGDPSAHPEWFEWGACHGHYHFKLYAEYRLWTPANFAKWDAYRKANPTVSADDAIAATGATYLLAQKQGFCVIDVVLYTVGAPKYLVCDFQGISVGWADEYSTALDGQYVDVTGLPHGTYVLEEEVNAHQLYQETSYANNRASVTVTI
jgi:hypothetical protein